MDKIINQLDRMILQEIMKGVDFDYETSIYIPSYPEYFSRQFVINLPEYSHKKR
jgi:hypothetical protein